MDQSLRGTNREIDAAMDVWFAANGEDTM
jgi:hypothetical protein